MARLRAPFRSRTRGIRLPFFYGWVLVGVSFVTMAVGVNARTAFSLLFPAILDEFGWDPDEVRDLIRTTPLRFGDDGQPVSYEAKQLFGLEAA